MYDLTAVVFLPLVQLVFIAVRIQAEGNLIGFPARIHSVAARCSHQLAVAVVETLHFVADIWLEGHLQLIFVGGVVFDLERAVVSGRDADVPSVCVNDCVFQQVVGGDAGKLQVFAVGQVHAGQSVIVKVHVLQGSAA